MPNRLRKNYVGTWELRGSVRVAQEENTPARWPVSVTIPTISPASRTRSEPIRFPAIVCAAIFVRVVRRLSTVPSRHGLVDFEERMVIE
jgi:hypothetical protein